MYILIYDLLVVSVGIKCYLCSFYFGWGIFGCKVYLQVVLYVDEVLFLFVVQVFFEWLQVLDVVEVIFGEIVFVLMVNFIGFVQELQGLVFGCFDFVIGINFNCYFKYLIVELIFFVEVQLGVDVDVNVCVIWGVCCIFIDVW